MNPPAPDAIHALMAKADELSARGQSQAAASLWQQVCDVSRESLPALVKRVRDATRQNQPDVSSLRTHRVGPVQRRQNPHEIERVEHCLSNLGEP